MKCVLPVGMVRDLSDSLPSLLSSPVDSAPMPLAKIQQLNKKITAIERRYNFNQFTISFIDNWIFRTLIILIQNNKVYCNFGGNVRN